MIPLTKNVIYLSPKLNYIYMYVKNVLFLKLIISNHYGHSGVMVVMYY